MADRIITDSTELRDTVTRNTISDIAADLESRPGIVVVRDRNGIPRQMYREFSLVMDRLLALGWIEQEHHDCGKRFEDAWSAFSNATPLTWFC